MNEGLKHTFDKLRGWSRKSLVIGTLAVAASAATIGVLAESSSGQPINIAPIDDQPDVLPTEQLQQYLEEKGMKNHLPEPIEVQPNLVG